MPGSTLRKSIAFSGALLLIFFILQADCFARVGRGGSIGSRGSRSYNSPSSSYGSGAYQSQPRGTYNQPYGQRYNQPMGSSGGFFRNMMGGLAGGFLGSLLFRSLGFGGHGGWGGGGGIGLFEVLVIAALIFGVFRFIKKRRQRAMEGVYYQGVGSMGGDYSPSYQEPRYSGGVIDAPPPPPPPGMSPQGSARQADPNFGEQGFKEMAMDVFFKIQGAWTERNPGLVRSLLTDEMYNALEKDAEELRREKKFNKLDNIAVRSVDITEDWQESGSDFITVKFYANLLDYVVDEATGQVLNGSKTQPVKFEEYWTFTRRSGSREWILSAITQPN